MRYSEALGRELSENEITSQLCSQIIIGAKLSSNGTLLEGKTFQEWNALYEKEMDIVRREFHDRLKWPTGYTRYKLLWNGEIRNLPHGYSVLKAPTISITSCSICSGPFTNGIAIRKPRQNCIAYKKITWCGLCAWARCGGGV